MKILEELNENEIKNISGGEKVKVRIIVGGEVIEEYWEEGNIEDEPAYYL